MSENEPFTSGTLPLLLRSRTAAAIESGALHPISTTCVYVEDSGIRFVVRVVSNLERKAVALRLQHDNERRTGSPVNPFLPPDARLVVTAATSTHLCILNKFNVVNHHLLLVTRTFQDQREPLDAEDFEALWRCLREIDGLGFYNAGRRAGASQPHKHLQLVSLPLAPEGPAIPVEPHLSFSDSIEPSLGPGLWPFVHETARLEIPLQLGAPQAAAILLDTYHRLASSLKLDVRRSPYNLMVTRRWMLLVPRSRERCGPISINTLGYAGSLLVKNRDELDLVKRLGPLEMLSQVGVAKSNDRA